MELQAIKEYVKLCNNVVNSQTLEDKIYNARVRDTFKQKHFVTLGWNLLQYKDVKFKLIEINRKYKYIIEN